MFYLPDCKDIKSKDHYFYKYNKGPTFLDLLAFPKYVKPYSQESIFKSKPADLGIDDDEYLHYYDLNDHQKERFDNRDNEYVNHHKEGSKGSGDTQSFEVAGKLNWLGVLEYDARLYLRN